MEKEKTEVAYLKVGFFAVRRPALVGGLMFFWRDFLSRTLVRPAFPVVESFSPWIIVVLTSRRDLSGLLRHSIPRCSSWRPQVLWT